MKSKVVKAKERAPQKVKAGKKPTVIQPGFLNQPAPVVKRRRVWSEYLTIFNGVKWGATVTLLTYTIAWHHQELGLMAACVLVAIFMLLEWSASAWAEFKNRG